MTPLAVQDTMEILEGATTEPSQKDGNMFANLCHKARTNNILQIIGVLTY
jgi:hypothetical protein